jgi:putative tRNA adenosine deaminase-associated protein
MTGAPEARTSFAVRVSRPDRRWRVELLAADAGDELPALERALGEPGLDGWPPPFVLVVDSRLYFVVLRHGPGGMVRALISDATMLEWVLAAEVVERYGIGVDTEGAFDDDESGWPGGDLDVFADDGLTGEELRRIVTADDLWADEMVERIARRLGFADELTAAVAP